MRGTRLYAAAAKGSVSIFIYIFPTILVAGKREKKNKEELEKTKKLRAKTVLLQSCHRISITTHLEMI